MQCGSCIGGGSLVYGGVLIQPRRETFSRLLPQISYDDMDNIYYPRVLGQIGAAPIPDDVLDSPTYESHRVFIADSERAGFEVLRPNTSFDWDMVRQEIAGDIPRKSVLAIMRSAVTSPRNALPTRTTCARQYRAARPRYAVLRKSK
ncbi:MAG: hypothetical protein IPG06_20460 [Haliea sp.]|nr:hypothetical protein [Haliea sp.]